MSRWSGLVVALVVSLVAGRAFADAAKTPPNVVILLADDLGYGDLSCYGHPTIRTPNLDRMAAEGMRFTDFYVAETVCTPSRAALLTGRLPVRSGMCGDVNRVIMRWAKNGLPASEITLPQALKDRGYATACIGKWHLGHQPEFWPTKRGFDYYYGLLYSNDMEPAPGMPKGASKRLDQDLKWWNARLFRNEELIEQPADLRTLTKRYTDESLKFIDRSKDANKPFFLYLAYTYPHVPLFASEQFQKTSARGLYGDVVEELDWSAGRVLDHLKKSGLADNTLVVFTSDNGPWLIQELAGGSAGLLRDGKGSTYEGGMREPGIMWWPGHIKPAQVTHEMASTLDLFPTIIKLAGGDVPKDRPMDGGDLTPLLTGQGHSPREVMFYWRGTKLYAVRQGAFKAHFITRTAYGPDDTELHDPPVLYNLESDPSERFDVAAEFPEVAAALKKLADEHVKDVGKITPLCDEPRPVQQKKNQPPK